MKPERADENSDMNPKGGTEVNRENSDMNHEGFIEANREETKKDDDDDAAACSPLADTPCVEPCSPRKQKEQISDLRLENDDGNPEDSDVEAPYERPPWHSFLLFLMGRAKPELEVEEFTQQLLDTMNEAETNHFHDLISDFAEKERMDTDSAFLVFLGDLQRAYDSCHQGG